MLFINERYWVRRVAALCHKQYDKSSDKIGIMHRLDALDPETATADEVDAIIGNVTWTTQTCCLCDKPKRNVVVFGQRDRSATLCVECVPKLHDFIKANT